MRGGDFDRGSRGQRAFWGMIFWAAVLGVICGVAIAVAGDDADAPGWFPW